MENASARTPFDPDAAEEYITNLCIDVTKERNRVFQKDNENRKDKANPWYSDLQPAAGRRDGISPCPRLFCKIRIIRRQSWENAKAAVARSSGS